MDRFVSGAVRGFGDERFLARIRQRASAPLLRLLALRLARGTEPATLCRAARGEELRERLGRERCVGGNAENRAHWLFPITHDKPDALAALLQARGFDATRKASSIGVMDASASQAQAAFQNLLYVPAHEGMSSADVARLARAIIESDAVSTQP